MAENNINNKKKLSKIWVLAPVVFLLLVVFVDAIIISNVFNENFFGMLLFSFIYVSQGMVFSVFLPFLTIVLGGGAIGWLFLISLIPAIFEIGLIVSLILSLVKKQQKYKKALIIFLCLLIICSGVIAFFLFGFAWAVAG